MLFGIDMFGAHLDQIRDAGWDEFKIWNGGKLVNGKVEGGDAAFAGRNFLGGSFLWGHAEATDAKTHPHPEDLTKIHPVVTRIAPIQAPQPDRQSTANERGRIYGQIDAKAICD